MSVKITTIRLPLSELSRVQSLDLKKSVEAFTAHHGYAPGEETTWGEWFDVPLVPDLAQRILSLALVLTSVHHDRREELIKAAVMVAYMAAESAQPQEPIPAAKVALDHVKRWLDGERFTLETLGIVYGATYWAAPASKFASATFATAEAIQVVRAAIVLLEDETRCDAARSLASNVVHVCRCADDDFVESPRHGEYLEELLLGLDLRETA